MMKPRIFSRSWRWSYIFCTRSRPLWLSLIVQGLHALDTLVHKLGFEFLQYNMGHELIMAIQSPAVTSL